MPHALIQKTAADIAQMIEDSAPGSYPHVDNYSFYYSYPPDVVEEPYATLLGLSVDSERRAWSLPGTNAPALICELWSEPKDDGHYPLPNRSGGRMCASVVLLKELCTKTAQELIFLVKIERQEHRHYSSRSEDDLDLVPPSHKVFILSSNGKLRDTTKSHTLG